MKISLAALVLALVCPASIYAQTMSRPLAKELFLGRKIILFKIQEDSTATACGEGSFGVNGWDVRPPILKTQERDGSVSHDHRLKLVLRTQDGDVSGTFNKIIIGPNTSSDDLFIAETATDQRTQLQNSTIPNGHSGFLWKPALQQSLLFLAVQHGYALTQPKTRRDLKGPFLKDYFRSVGNLHGWEDGGRFFTNYLAHPLQGSLTGFIQIQNDPKGKRQQFGRSQTYWKSRMKAMGWAAAMSTQFEIGPISQASIGNVGLHGKQTYVDLVVTPTLGTALIIGEDMLDRYVTRWVEKRWKSNLLRMTTRMVLSPGRSCANLLRFKKPWYRDY